MPSARGAPGLRSVEIDCTADELIVTAGGNQAFLLALMALIEEGDEVLLPAPYFINHEMAIGAIGGEVRSAGVIPGVPIPPPHGEDGVGCENG